MHEAKYDPMEKADAEAIMEEILGMQCGLNPDQQVRENFIYIGFTKILIVFLIRVLVCYMSVQRL